MTKPFYQKGPPPHDPAPRPMLVGLTGGLGAGKSSAGRALKKMGFRVINTDDLTHEILDTPDLEAYRKVVERFGPDLVMPDGSINRVLLRQRAFVNDSTKAELQAIMHPAIAELLERHIQKHLAEPVIFVEVPLLHESNWKEHFDEVWCIIAQEVVRLKRVMVRDGIDEAAARRRIAQHKLTQDEKAARSDYVLDNSTTEEALGEQIAQLVAELRLRIKARSAKPIEDPSNDHMRDVIRRAAQMGADSALDRMGDVSTTGHKEGVAKVRLSVDTCEGDHPDGDTDTDSDPTGEHAHRSQEVEVDVRLRVRHKRDSTGTEGCACRCGDTCRISCACAPDCGCTCKKPDPCPDSPDKVCKHWHSRLYALLGLFGLLAFLAFVILMFWYWTRPDSPVTPTPPVIVTPPTDPGTPPTPPVTHPDPFRPPTAPEPPPAPASTRKAVLDEPPGYAFNFLHNAVRVRVGKWDEVEDENGIVLKGFDPDKRLVVFQVYDAHHWMTHQWVVTYHPNGSVHVDRFEGRLNRFVGRTVYFYNQYGGLERVRFEGPDGVTRISGTITRGGGGRGAIGSMHVINYDPQGREKSKNVIAGVDAVNTFIDENFYLTRWFGGT